MVEETGDDEGGIIVWSSMLDNRYACSVTRLAYYIGTLNVTDTTTGANLLTEEVGLAYGAAFGPDIDDVMIWQDKCTEAIDSQPPGG